VFEPHQACHAIWPENCSQIRDWSRKPPQRTATESHSLSGLVMSAEIGISGKRAI
jgi:hypothetical protein